MKSLISSLIVVIACALLGACAARDPDLPIATQAFQKRHPEYVIRSLTVRSSSESKKNVLVEFDAPNNAKNRGRAELFMGKDTNGSWVILGERVHMWRN